MAGPDAADARRSWRCRGWWPCPRLRPLWDRRAVLSRLRIERPAVRVHAFEEGGDDIPRLRPGGRRRRARCASAGWSSRAASWCSTTSACRSTSTCPASAAAWRSGPRGARRAALASARATARFGYGPAARPSRTEMDLAPATAPPRAWSPARLRAPSAPTSPTAASCSWRRGRGRARPSTGRSTWACSTATCCAPGFGLEGARALRGLGARSTGSRLRLKGRLDGDGRRLRRRRRAALRRATWPGTTRRLHLRGSSWQRPRRHRARRRRGAAGGRARRACAARAARRGRRGAARARLFDIGPAGLGAGATGDVDARAGRAAAPRADRRVAPWTSRRAPTAARRSTGRFEWRAEDGAQCVEHGRPAHAAHAACGSSGRDRARPRAPTSTWRPSSRDLAAGGRRWAPRLRRALGNADAAAAGLARRGPLPRPLARARSRARLRGTLRRRRGPLPGRGAGASAEWAGALSRARGALALAGPAPATAAELWLDGRMETGLPGRGRRARRARAPRAAGPRRTSRGAGLGRWRGRAGLGRRAAMHGPAQRAARRGRAARRRRPLRRRALRGPRARRRASPATSTEVTRGRARRGRRARRLPRHRHRRRALRRRGRADGRGAGRAAPRRARRRRAGAAALARPRGAAGHASAAPAPARRTPDLRRASSWATRAWARSRRACAGAGDGARAGERDAAARARVDLALSGDVGAPPPYDAALRSRTRETSLDPVPARLLAPRCPATVGAGGERRRRTVRGPLRDPRALAADGRLTDLQLAAARLPGAQPRAAVGSPCATARSSVRRPAPRAARAPTSRWRDGAALAGRTGRWTLDRARAPPTCARCRCCPASCAAAARARLAMSVVGRPRDAPALDGHARPWTAAPCACAASRTASRTCRARVRFTQDGAALRGRHGHAGRRAARRWRARPPTRRAGLRPSTSRPAGATSSPALPGGAAQP